MMQSLLASTVGVGLARVRSDEETNKHIQK